MGNRCSVCEQRAGPHSLAFSPGHGLHSALRQEPAREEACRNEAGCEIHGKGNDSKQTALNGLKVGKTPREDLSLPTGDAGTTE